MTQDLARNEDLHRAEDADAVLFAKGREERRPETFEEAGWTRERGKGRRELGDDCEEEDESCAGRKRCQRELEKVGKR